MFGQAILVGKCLMSDHYFKHCRLSTLTMVQFSSKNWLIHNNIAKKNIQQAQSTQKKQYDKFTHPMTFQVGNLVMINEQLKFKLDEPYHGSFLECMK